MIAELANHLWQSTLFAFAVGLLTWMCRKNDASVRYWLWFSASVKFFIPFTLLIALGGQLELASKAPQITTPAVSVRLAQVGRPFIEDSAIGVPFSRWSPSGCGRGDASGWPCAPARPGPFRTFQSLRTSTCDRPRG
jgi:hypothetical protein